MMRYGSVCSGIEAATVAWHPLGWAPQWFSEVEKFPSRVLKHHYPNVPNLGDILKLEQNEKFRQSTIDFLVGGTPCQSFSLAGLRGGLGDERGNLALEFCRILVRKQPRWFLWENVPGVFSSFTDEAGSEPVAGIGRDHGRDVTQTADFATLLAAFQKCGYSCAWRVLDAQYFGVPQRRRRVFVVGHLGNDWRPPFAVLFERESLRGDITPRRKKGQEVAGTLAGRPTGGGFPGTDESVSGYVQPWPAQVASTLNANFGEKQGLEDQHINQGAPLFVPIAFDNAQITNPTNRSNPNVDIHQTLVAGGDPCVIQSAMVRRLTPLECERLQGFPDNYTVIPGAADGPRYKALGNSMAIPVMRWIGDRIEKIDRIITQPLNHHRQTC